MWRRYFETSLLFATLSYTISNEHAAAPDNLRKLVNLRKSTVDYGVNYRI